MYLNAGGWAEQELRAILPVYPASQPAFSDWAAGGAEVWAGPQALPPAAASRWSLQAVCEPVPAVGLAQGRVWPR